MKKVCGKDISTACHAVYVSGPNYLTPAISDCEVLHECQFPIGQINLIGQGDIVNLKSLPFRYIQAYN